MSGEVRTTQPVPSTEVIAAEPLRESLRGAPNVPYLDAHFGELLLRLDSIVQVAGFDPRESQSILTAVRTGLIHALAEELLLSERAEELGIEIRDPTSPYEVGVKLKPLSDRELQARFSEVPVNSESVFHAAKNALFLSALSGEAENSARRVLERGLIEPLEGPISKIFVESKSAR